MQRERHTIDATDKIAGRLATRVAVLLQGKNKPSYQPHTDCGDIVEISNVAQMKFTGKKLTQKLYHSPTGYPGGVTTKKLTERMERRPDELLRHMVLRMLPNNKLRKRMIQRLLFVKK